MFALRLTQWVKSELATGGVPQGADSVMISNPATVTNPIHVLYAAAAIMLIASLVLQFADSLQSQEAMLESLSLSKSLCNQRNSFVIHGHPWCLPR
jgi:hypothetical protein